VRTYVSSKPMVKKIKDDLKPKSPASSEPPSRIYDSRSKIFNSNFIKEIHELKKMNHTHD